MVDATGANPQPPATINTFLCITSSTGHPLPNGPLYPSTSPFPKENTFWVKCPTFLMRALKRPVLSGIDVYVKGARPALGTVNIKNWPILIGS